MLGTVADSGQFITSKSHESNRGDFFSAMVGKVLINEHSTIPKVIELV